jgi:hypothetical protein
MVRRFSRTFRLWVVIAAVAQALLPGIAGIADAYAFRDSGSAAVQSHIEEHGTPHCPRVHQEDNCALCQFVGGALAIAHHPASFELAAARLAPTAARASISHDLVDDASPSLPRAPPVTA